MKKIRFSFICIVVSISGYTNLRFIFDLEVNIINNINRILVHLSDVLKEWASSLSLLYCIRSKRLRLYQRKKYCKEYKLL
jgi:hypothetical protein